MTEDGDLAKINRKSYIGRDGKDYETVEALQAANRDWRLQQDHANIGKFHSEPILPKTDLINVIKNVGVDDKGRGTTEKLTREK